MEHNTTPYGTDEMDLPIILPRVRDVTFRFRQIASARLRLRGELPNTRYCTLFANHCWHRVLTRFCVAG
jgi:hypothetical protein